MLFKRIQPGDGFVVPAMGEKGKVAPILLMQEGCNIVVIGCNGKTRPFSDDERSKLLVPCRQVVPVTF